ncbi:MAG TPA: hypothetical protein VE085_10325 [Burkholderiales bacterium]|nr:hypothetical protein [Burkholderiales bacterium]
MAACSTEEAVNARVAAGDVRDWETLYDVFHRFGHCTAVPVSEAFSQSIGHLLAARWSELYELEYFAEANRAFRVFVVEHIDVTISAADLRRIVDHVETCPGYARPICREIASRSRYALRLRSSGVMEAK